MNDKKKHSIEIEHPHIREIDERTLHPGVEEERKQDLVKDTTEQENQQVQQAQG